MVVVDKQEFDVILFDILLFDMNGIEVFKCFKCKLMCMLVLMFLMYCEDQYVVCVLKVGVVGYLLKMVNVVQMIGVIQQVVVGCKYVSFVMVEVFVEYVLFENELLLYEKLFDCEYQMFCMFVFGKWFIDIVNMLLLLVKMVSVYWLWLFEKMWLFNNVEFMFYVMSNWFVDMVFMVGV